MFPVINKRGGQSVLEYAIVIGAVVIALLVMQAYVRRSLQGKFKVIADDLGQQYNPYNTTSDMNITFESDTQTETFTNVTTDATGKEKRETTTNTTIFNETQTRQGSETVGL
ncbi:MAG: hypothetical protein Q7J72_03920 [Candidatus Omnitrophota bacterium]|nr:hypothetical protein [Candidatus Omnitrophota bacterium]